MPFRPGYLFSPERLPHKPQACEASEVYERLSSWDYVRGFVARTLKPPRKKKPTRIMGTK